MSVRIDGMISNALEAGVRVLADAGVPEELLRHSPADGDPRGKLVRGPRAKCLIASETREHRADALVELEAVHRAFVLALRGEQAEGDVHQVQRRLDVELEDAFARTLTVDEWDHQRGEIERRSLAVHVGSGAADINDEVVDGNVVLHHRPVSQSL